MMLTRVASDGLSVEVTEEALTINAFKELYKDVKDRLYKPTAIAYFSYLHFMYSYDSQFLYKYEDEKKRSTAVKKFIVYGDHVVTSPKLKAAVKVFKSLSNEDVTSTYVTMVQNMLKLKEYASKMVLAPPPDEDLLPGIDYHLVDYKEFSAVNSLLPTQQGQLAKYEDQLKDYAVSKVSAYGGGDLGAFE